MKKLILNTTFDKGEVLTRSQLRKVLGGMGSDCPEGCGTGLMCCPVFRADPMDPNAPDTYTWECVQPVGGITPGTLMCP